MSKQLTDRVSGLLANWLQTSGGCDLQTWEFGHEYLEAVPAGYRAVVEIRLERTRAEAVTEQTADRSAEA